MYFLTLLEIFATLRFSSPAGEKEGSGFEELAKLEQTPRVCD